MERSKDPLVSFITQYKQILLVAGVAITASIIGYFSYGFYRSNIEIKAHKALTDSLSYYNASVKTLSQDNFSQSQLKVFATDKEKWEATSRVFEQAYADNGNSSLAPFFLMYQAEALKHLGKLEKAIEITQQIVHILPDNELSDAFRIKEAVMNLDHTFLDTSTEAQEKEMRMIERLEIKTGDDSYVFHDFVLYYLGDYYWAKKDFNKVRNYWKMLLLKYGKGSEYPSPWVSLAKPRLKLIES